MNSCMLCTVRNTQTGQIHSSCSTVVQDGMQIETDTGDVCEARKEVVEAYRPVLSLAGDKEKGRALFIEQCSKCHVLEGQGFAVGPDLSAIGNRGTEAILLNVLDPNAEINPAYVNYTIETNDFETYSGLISAETATSITLSRASGEADTILRVNIESVESAELSLMPEGLEASIDQQAMADLIAYLVSLSSGNS